MDVTVTEAQPDQRDLLANLLELNAYEFSRFDARPIGSDGRYGYTYLELYWSEENRWPYIAWTRDELAGFALVRSEDGALSIAEFLVLPKFRRSGVGTMIAREVIGRHRGRWNIHQVPGNAAATLFWRQAIPVSFDEEINEAGSVVQRFAT